MAMIDMNGAFSPMGNFLGGMPGTCLEDPVPIEEQAAADATLLSGQLSGVGHRLFAPAGRRRLRAFSSTEAARLIGVSDGYLRQLSLSGDSPRPSNVSLTGRRGYTLADIHALREHLAAQGGTKERYYLPYRNPAAGEQLQIVAVTNCSAGSGKTTTATHLAQYLALHGYRVLAIDLDPQAAMSALLGCQPGLGPDAKASICGAMADDDEHVPFRSVIRKTHFPGLDISPSNLRLQEFQHGTSRRLAMRKEGLLDAKPFARVKTAIATVGDDYDVVILDCPPQLGYLTVSALCAATAVIVTVNPRMPDVVSVSQFLDMISEILSQAREAGAMSKLSFLRYLITQYEMSDAVQTQIVGFLRTQFGERVLTTPMVKSTAIADAALAGQTLFEAGRETFPRAIYDRAIESVTSVSSEIERLIRASWGRAG